MPRAKKSTRGTTSSARVGSDVDAHLRAERRGARTPAWRSRRRPSREISPNTTFAQCEKSGYSEFDELGVRVSASSVAERALAAEVKTLED